MKNKVTRFLLSRPGLLANARLAALIAFAALALTRVVRERPVTK